jgi:hypothetical protein
LRSVATLAFCGLLGRYGRLRVSPTSATGRLCAVVSASTSRGEG